MLIQTGVYEEVPQTESAYTGGSVAGGPFLQVNMVDVLEGQAPVACPLLGDMKQLLVCCHRQTASID